MFNSPTVCLSTVDCTKSLLDEHGIAQGDCEHLDVREAKVVVNDYAV
jgi:hypothetical protein